MKRRVNALVVMLLAFSPAVLVRSQSSPDVGPQVMAAIAALGTGAHGTPNCGTISWPHGTYSLRSTIVKPRCVLLDFQNSILVAQASGNAMIVTGDVLPTANPYDPRNGARGGISHLTLAGSGVSTSKYGIWMGSGAPGGPSQTLLDVLETFTDIHVTNFAEGVTVGVNASQNIFLGGSFEGNNDGMYWAAGSAAENISMFGAQILNNYEWGINAANAGGQLNLYGCSLDYNGSGGSRTPPVTGGAVHWENGNLNIVGSYFEQGWGYLIQSTSPSSRSTIHITGDSSFYTSAYAGNGPPGYRYSDDAYFDIGSLNIQFAMDSGVQFATQHSYRGLIYFHSPGTDNRFNLGTYTSTRIGAGGVNVPAYIPNFTSTSTTANVVMMPLNVPGAVSHGIQSGSQTGLVLPNLQLSSAHAVSGTRFACFDTQGNLISSPTPCAGK